MIIAIAVNENHLKAIIDPHFGRCSWYCIYDTQKQQHIFIENPERYQQTNAGCNAADLLITKGINMAIAGRFGSKVVELFRKQNIQMVIPELQQTVEELINQIKIK